MIIQDGPHYATGHNIGPDAPKYRYRTSADGLVWAFTNYGDALKSYAMTLEQMEQDYTLEERGEYLEGFTIQFHNRPASECGECDYSCDGMVDIEVFEPHWSVRNERGYRQSMMSEWHMADAVRTRRAEDPVKHDTMQSCDCEED